MPRGAPTRGRSQGPGDDVTETLWRAALRHSLYHPWQLGLAVLGIAMGVAVVVSIDLANTSARRAFELSATLPPPQRLRIEGQLHQLSGDLDRPLERQGLPRAGARRRLVVVQVRAQRARGIVGHLQDEEVAAPDALRVRELQRALSSGPERRPALEVSREPAS